MEIRTLHQSIEGIVVGSRTFSESGRFIDVLTPAHGRISVVARGARASKKRFVGALDLFITLDMELRTKKEPWNLEAAQIINPRLGIRSNLEAFKRAQIICDIVRSCSHEHIVIDGFYESVSTALDLLASGESVAAASLYPVLLKNVGVFPDIKDCTRCQDRPATVLTRCQQILRPSCLACSSQESCSESYEVLCGGYCSNQSVAKRVEDFTLDCFEEYLGHGLKTRRICAAL
ncbi:MAG: DNA repair protein RecO [Myxococcales bacterium]|nr:DNA repair protein RecO [Myxococcales bacterium]